MKKYLSIALALTLVFCMALSASAAVTCYMDAEFTADGKVSDKIGNATLEHVNGGFSTIGNVEVEHAGKKYTVPAFEIAGLTTNTPSDYITGTYDFADLDAYLDVFGKNMTIEIFFQNTLEDPTTNDVESMIFGNTYSAGWAILVAHAKNIGTARIIISTKEGINGASYLSLYNDEPTYMELTHFVLTYEYDESADTTYAVTYVNGVEVASMAKGGSLYQSRNGASYKYFGIGANYRTSPTSQTTSSALNCRDLVVVDAKMYSGTATADEVEKMYNDAVAALNVVEEKPTATPTATPTAAPTTAPTTTPSTPSTGDTGVVAFLAIMAIISMAAVAVVAKKEH